MNCKIEEYISNNYHELLRISKAITKGHQLHQELLHEVILQLYDKEVIKLKKWDDNDIKYYITAILRINWNSKTSPFYYKIRKETFNWTELTHTIEEIETEQEAFEKQQLFDILEQSFCDLNWFHKSLMEMYLTLGSLKKVSTKTTIPITSISRYIKEAKTEIKDTIEKQMK